MDKETKPENRNLLIEQIVQIEWGMFQKVNGLGGRASCQDEWPTFHIMRYSNYSAWPDKILQSFRKDLEQAEASGRNLITEKYAYMMEYTDPDYYREKLAPYLPKSDEESIILVNRIVDFMVACEQAFSAQYPKISHKGRPVTSASGIDSITSVETYTRGELRTYSKATLGLLEEYVRQCKSNGTNLVMSIKEQMVKMYGYASLEDAERKM